MNTNPTKQSSTIFNDIIGAIARRRRFVFLSVVFTTIASVGIVLLFPRYYVSTTTILPPRSSGLFGGLSEVSSLVKQFSPLKNIAGLPSGSGDLYNYITILQSRPAQERLIKTFDLKQVYSISGGSMEKTLKALKENIDLIINEEGTLSIRVFDTDAIRAARMADSLVCILDEMNIAINTKQAHSNRVFIEERLEQNRSELISLEDSIKLFQEKNGIVIIPQDATSSIAGYTQIYGLKTLKELQIGMMKQNMSPDNVLLLSAEHELAEMNKQLGAIPQLGTSFLKLYRDYMVQQKMFEVLTPLYEQARIEEKRDTPTLLVLETANIPERPTRPKRMVIVAVFAFLSFFLSTAFVYYRESLQTMKRENPGSYQSTHELWLNFRKIFSIHART